MREKIASLAAVVFSLGVASSASAANLTTTAPYTAADTVFSWSGAYVGLHAGYSWGANRWTSGGVLEDPTIVVSPVSPATNSALGGVQAGANYQTGNWVVGFEWDFAVLGHKSSAAGTLSQLGFVFPTTATSKLDWLTQFTGRAGFAFDRTLVYVKGGVAAGEAKDSFSLLSPIPLFLDFGTKTNLLTGWVGGVGVEHFFGPNWSAKIEYDYVDLGNTAETYTSPIAGGTITLRETIEHKLQIVKVGANYKF